VIGPLLCVGRPIEARIRLVGCAVQRVWERPCECRLQSAAISHATKALARVEFSLAFLQK
ncbi:MAG: hypothetical protein RI566_14485, partial [Sediminimonas sp.]|uniref:hypothetical protein n=1 Tax=Sediminimonas sp. TaxID=2823379 RepID=UPI00286FED41